MSNTYVSLSAAPLCYEMLAQGRKKLLCSNVESKVRDEKRKTRDNCAEGKMEIKSIQVYPTTERRKLGSHKSHTMI